jgi:hypothetical protein
MGNRMSGRSGRMEGEEVSEVITDARMAALVGVARRVVNDGLEKGKYPLNEQQVINSPLVAAVFSALVEEDRRAFDGR